MPFASKGDITSTQETIYSLLVGALNMFILHKFMHNHLINIISIFCRLSMLNIGFLSHFVGAPFKHVLYIAQCW